MIHPHFPHYFTHHLNKETKEVYWQASLFNLALAMAYIFEPIFLHRLGYNLVQILEFYALVYVCYCLFIFTGAKFAGRFGYKHSILFSSIFYVVYWIIFYQIHNFTDFFWVAPILFALQKSFFWPAYNAEVAISENRKQRGREVGVLFSLIELMVVVGPFLGGWLLSAYGFNVLFFTSSFLILLSTYPLFKTPDVYTRHTFRISNFFKVCKKYPLNFFGYWGYAEDLMLMTLWPIVVFTSVSGVFGLGVITTFASIIATVLMLYVGRLFDRLKKKELVQASALFYGLTWVFRFLAVAAGKVWPIFSFEVLGRLGKGTTNVSMVSMTYAIAGSKDADSAIAYSVFYEFSLSVGKVFTALGAIFILELTGSIGWVFVFVGILTMFYGLLKK